MNNICKQIWFITLLLLVMSSTTAAQSVEKLWKQVAQAEKNSLPATAIKLTDEIYSKARLAKNTPQMLKAYTWRMKYRETLVPDSFYVGLQGLQQWVSSTDNPIDRAVLHSLIAGMYADYADQNRWLLRQRTAVIDENASTDIREWSGNQFVDQISQHLAASLQPADLLLNQSAAAYVPFVELGKTSGTYYKHNLYQLLGTRAIESLRTASSIAQDSVVNAQIDTIFKQLLETNRAANRMDGYLLTMLDYLEWRRTTDPTFRSYRAPKGLIGLTQDPYLAELNKLTGEFKSTVLCAEVFLARARYAYNENQAVAALQLCDEAIRRYPGYARIGELKNLKQEILNPALSVSVQQTVYPDSTMKLQVNHKNLDGFTVQLYHVNLSQMPELPQGITADFYRKHCQKIVEKRMALARPNTYQQADTALTLATPTVGLYLMQIIPDAKTAAKREENVIQVTRFKVLTRSLPNKQYEVVALHMKTGYPIADAVVTLYSANGKELNRLTTDKRGKVVFPWNNEYRQVNVRKGEDTAMPLQAVYRGSYFYQTQDKSTSQVKLLTDRSLYRPGQTVHVKGIAYSQLPDTAQVIADANYTLTLLDANRQEVAKQELRTNAFGSFATSFTLPAACLNGVFTLQTVSGSATIRVEEYKRPTFDITFDKRTQSYRLGDRVEVKGQVKTFSGVALQNLPMQYTVTRLLRFGWRIPSQASDPIASGTVQLNAEGVFTIPVALEGEKEMEAGYYLFQVNATVTNLAGETQTTSYALPVGNRSLLLSTTLPERVCKDDNISATFQAMNLNDQPVTVSGTVMLYSYLPNQSTASTNPDEAKVADQAAYSGTFTSNQACQLPAWQTLPSGAYQLVLSARDDQGREVTYKTRIVLFSVQDTRPPVDTAEWFYAPNTSFDAAHPALFYFGTSMKDAYVMADVFCGDQLLESKVLQLSDSIVRFDYPYQETYGNGLTISFCFVKDQKVYHRQVELSRRLADKTLALKWDVFRDKLRPGQQEEWKLTIRTPQALPAAAEMLATMYDASLDKISNQQQTLQLYYNLPLPSVHWMEEYTRYNSFYCAFPFPAVKVPELVYDRFSLPSSGIIGGLMPSYGGSTKSLSIRGVSAVAKQSRTENRVDAPRLEEFVSVETSVSDAIADNLPEADNQLRTNFAETAFFYPQLRTNEQGEVVFSFTMPQSLTRWNFRGYAHTKGMLTGMLQGEATTSKEFMLTPNLPRFVRVGDQTRIAASLTNLTGKSVSGVTTFILFDPLTDKVMVTQKQPFTVEAGKTRAMNFGFTVSDQYELLGCRMIADGGTFSDGEQQLLPVLSDKVNLTESVQLVMRGKEKRTFGLDSLFNRHSPSATHKRLTVEFTGNPAWLAVLALPSLSQPQSDNVMDWAAMYYANTLASFIMNSQPRIRALFDSWKQQGGTKETFLSNLQKNQELKNILLAESPWVMQAQTQQQQQERIGTLFDLNNIRNNNLTALTKLKELQLADGSWSWYKGMSGNAFVTHFVVETQARLVRLTGEPLDAQAQAMYQSAFGYLHTQALAEYKALRKAETEGRKASGLSTTALKYLYLIAISNEKVPESNEAAHRYFLTQLPSMITTMSMSDKARTAIVLKKAGQAQKADAFMASLKEHLVVMPEQGVSFAASSVRNRWSELRIPAHVAVMEAFEQVSNDSVVVEEMKIWLLRQKQTQQWDSPVATVDAVYGLLSTGMNLLASAGDVRLTVGAQVMQITTPAQGTIAGLGYLKETFTNPKVVDARRITVEKSDAGLAWGAVYGQYLEQIAQVKRQGNELTVEKKLYVERLVNNVLQLEPLTAGKPLTVGDKVVSRLTVRLDRPMQFLQLKDQYAACLEPIGGVSGYQWSNGLGYYRDVKDASTLFFFEELSKGVFVLESSYRVSRAGTYEAGLATLQSAYAPEFVAHSETAKIIVK
ncbi:alpha-2-macroglobulin family protein [Bacteroides sp.]|uniref:alpha-2-macroglobulin family protein n=2 Tax=Bacteroides sp. TaxID=29523 RepID=UPI0025BD3DDA|nr:alpha-2-macroglobulin family protein [Bacteroides sp.]